MARPPARRSGRLTMTEIPEPEILPEIPREREREIDVARPPAPR